MATELANFLLLEDDALASRTRMELLTEPVQEGNDPPEG